MKRQLSQTEIELVQKEKEALELTIRECLSKYNLKATDENRITIAKALMNHNLNNSDDLTALVDNVIKSIRSKLI